MSHWRQLQVGDASFAKSFKKVSRSTCGTQEVSASFNAPKGREFVVLLLGDVDKGTGYTDIEKMLNELGFYRKQGGDDE